LQDIEAAVREIQCGDEQKREELITLLKELIHKYTCFICKRRLEWQNDDELSVALIAFNRAIDTFDSNLNNCFTAYAKLLIKNSLIDHFRSQEKLHPLSLDNIELGETLSSAEIAASWQSYLGETENRNRAFEIQLLKEILESLGLSFEKLIQNSPQHVDTRENLKEAARKVAGEPELVRRIYNYKQLPLKEIQLLTGMNKKTLQKWRRYLLSLIVIFNSGEMESLVEYIWGKRGEQHEKS